MSDGQSYLTIANTVLTPGDIEGHYIQGTFLRAKLSNRDLQSVYKTNHSTRYRPIPVISHLLSCNLTNVVD